MDKYIDIPVPKIFDFNVNLQFLNRNANECTHEVKDHALIKYVEISSLKSLIKISAPNKSILRLHFLAGDLPQNKEDEKLFIDYVEHLFDLNKDLHAFYKLAEADPLLQKPVIEAYGLRIVQIPDLFEALAWGILGQQINLNFAYQLKREIVEKYGQSITYKGEIYWLFPSAKRIANLTVDKLSKIKMTRRKSEFMIGIAELIASGQLSRETLLSLGSKEVIEKEIVKIRGIGPWTANYLLMRSFGFPDAFPIADVGLHNAIKKQLKLDKKPSIEEILKLSQNWTGYEAYATFYLWYSL